MIVTRAPLRLSIGGGGTDLPFYSSKFGGSLVTAGIDKYIYIILEKRDFYNEFLIRYSQTEKVKKIEEIKHPAVKAALEYLKIKEPLEIVSIADVPSGTGLGSSASFLVALLRALHTYRREYVSNKQLAEEASEIEMNILKKPIGKQDQYAAAFGGLLYLEIAKNQNVVQSPLDISYSTLEELQNNMLLFSTDIKHSTEEIIKQQAKEAESEKEKMEQMHIIKDIGNSIIKELKAGNTKAFGKWLNVHWEAKRKFTKKMSCPEIDKAYQEGIKAGATGGKLVGAGGGGFLMFYCDKNKERLRQAMTRLGLRELTFRFDMEGCKVIYEGR